MIPVIEADENLWEVLVEEFPEKTVFFENELESVLLLTPSMLLGTDWVGLPEIQAFSQQVQREYADARFLLII